MKKRLAMLMAGCLMLSGAMAANAEEQTDDIWYQSVENLAVWENSESEDLYSYLDFGKETFDMEAYVGTELAANLIKNFNNYANYSDPMADEVVTYWEELGVKKELHDSDVAEQTWASYVPVEAFEEENETLYPVLFVMHGHGNSVWVTETYGFAQYGAEMDYITIIPEASDGDNLVAEFDRIMEYLQENGYPIDESRVYAASFSKGGYCVQNLAAARPDKIAAIAVGGNAPHTENGKDMSATAEELGALENMPMIVYSGDYDQNCFPVNEDSTLETADEKVAGYNLWISITGSDATEITLEESKELTASSEVEIEKLTGLTFSNTEVRELDGTNYHIGTFQNTDGVTTYEFVCIEGQMHWVAPSMPEICWEFLTQFSRDTETGALVY